jgi:hypothetical protein
VVECGEESGCEMFAFLEEGFGGFVCGGCFEGTFGSGFRGGGCVYPGHIVSFIHGFAMCVEEG